MLLIPAQVVDLPELLIIESASFIQPWSKAIFHFELSKSPSTIYVARRGPGTPVLGYICFWEVADEFQMLNLAVHPDHRRQGLGRTLLTILLKKAEGKKTSRVFLEVRPSNLTALALYRSVGFRILYRRPGYYPPEGEEALVMEWAR